uniref:Nephrocystin-3-like n=1 Tax=Saccoglossus kowalevskii TaxID=10224 RepID=A0ABM0M8L8_SACKO|nr:PREDICTED: nephrocystin-3-like [Saccoglossus kowalevskii]
MSQNFSFEEFNCLHLPLKEFIYGNLFAYEELSGAVKERYCHDDDDYKKYIAHLATYFNNKLELCSPDHNTKISNRVINELPWLLEKLGDIDRLKKCLLHLAVFLTLFKSESKYDLFGYWNSTELSGEEISSLYMKSIDQQLVNMYLEQLESSETPDHPPAKKLVSIVYKIVEFLYEAGYLIGTIPLLKRARQMHIYAFSGNNVNIDDSELYCNIINQLAIVYVDLENFDEGEKLHKENLEMKKRVFGLKSNESYIATTLNGLGVICLRQRRLKEAEEYFQSSLELHKSGGKQDAVADTLTNIGNVRFQMKQYEDGKKVMEEALQIYENFYFGNLPPEVAGAINNLALCYKHLEQLDKAEELYRKAYTMTVNALGPRHPDVAEKLRNWGVFAAYKKNYDAAIDKYMKALEIYKDTFGEEHMETLLTMENISIAYIELNKHEEALKYFMKSSEILCKKGRLDVSLMSLNCAMINFCHRTGRQHETHKILERIVYAPWATDSMFHHLNHLDQQMPEKERPQRPYEMTLDYALTKYPGSLLLVHTKAEDFASAGDYQRTLDMLRNYDFKAEVYCDIYETFNKYNHKKEGFHILSEGNKKYPEHVPLLHFIGMWYAFYKDFDNAVEYMMKALEIEPSNVHTLFDAGRVYAVSGDLYKAKEILERNVELAKDSEFPDILESTINFLGVVNANLKTIEAKPSQE